MTDIDFDHLFALRVLLLDDYENENDILNELAYNLMDNGVTVDQVPNVLKEFYERFGIDISGNIEVPLTFANPRNVLGELDNFNNILTNLTFQINNPVLDTSPIIDSIHDIDSSSVSDSSDDESDISDNHMFEPFRNLNTLLEVFNNSGLSISSSSNGFISLQDVKTTLKEEDLNKIKKYEAEKNLEDKCSVCLTDIEVKQIVSELPCHHYFHTDCIEPWLKQYNYKCPVCRKEAGKPKHNI